MATYSAKVDECLWGLMCSGYKLKEIRHVLANDEGVAELLGGSVDMPIRTLSDKLRRLKEKRGEPTPPSIAPGEELAAITAMRQQALGFAKRHLRKLTDLEEPKTSDVKLVGELQRLVDRIEAALREGSRTKDPQRQEAARARHNGLGRGILAQIAEAEETPGEAPG